MRRHPLASLRVHHLVEHGLHAGLEPPRELVEDVAELVEPVPLRAGLRPHVAHGGPEAEGAVTHRDDGRTHAPALQVAEQSLPALGALAVAVLDRDQLLRPICPHADHHERAEPGRPPTGH